jgi:hypothetical protein
LLRFFRIRPQIRIRRLLFYFRKLLAQLTDVKDTPAGREPWSLKRCIAVPVHPTFLSLVSILFGLQYSRKTCARFWAAQRFIAAVSHILGTGFSR